MPIQAAAYPAYIWPSQCESCVPVTQLVDGTGRNTLTERVHAPDCINHPMNLEPLYPSCGTRAGYHRHLRNHTPTCQPCKNAVAKAIRQWRHNTGQSKATLIPDTVLKAHGITGTHQ